MITHRRRTLRLLAAVSITALLAMACSLDVAPNGASGAAPLENRTGGGSSSASLGAASSFAVLGTVVTLTDTPVTGDVGSIGDLTLTNSPIDGAIHAGDTVAQQAYSDFLVAYAAVGATANPTDQAHKLSGNLDGVTLVPGVYSFSAAATLTGVLTLDAVDDPNAVWIFKIGTSGTGALTATDFTVVMNGGDPSNVYWWVAQAVTMTRADFLGTILGGAAITFTGPGTFEGRALAKADVTLTGMVPFDVSATGVPLPGPGKNYVDRVTGGGWIKLPDGDKGTFSIAAGIRNGTLLRGHLEFEDHGAKGHRGWGDDHDSGLKVKGTSITRYLLVDAVTRQIEGTARVNGVDGYTYKVVVSDNGNGRNGRNDTFAITVYDAAGAVYYSASGTLGGGKIQLHASKAFQPVFDNLKLKADPFVYDPGRTRIIVSAWVRHTGLPDAGNSDWGLVLQKNGPTATNAAAGAVIKGANGERLTELGFDYTGYAGAGSPRFNVTVGGKTYFFGAAAGIHTDLGNGWTRVRFDGTDSWDVGSFGGIIQDISIVADEMGQSVLDNIDVNGTLIGGPGNGSNGD